MTGARSRLGQRVLLLLGLVALNAAALELALRWWVRDPAHVALLATSHADAPWRLAWVARRARGADAPYPIDSIHETRGWTLTPGLRDVATRGALVSSNARGARGTREHAIPKPPRLERVLLFGDSYAFGEEVGDEQTFAAGIERRLPGVEVVNLGVHGYGHDQMLLRLHEDAAAYQPDVVLLGYAPWDDERNLLSFRDYAKPHFALLDGRLELRGVPVPAPDEILAAEPWRSKLADLARLLARHLRWRYGDLKDERRALTDALLVAFVGDARAIGARPVLVYFPTAQDVAADAPSRREREVAELCRAHDVPFLSLRERFRRSLPEYASRTTAHWNPTEHDVAADELTSFLRDRVLPHGNAAASRP